MTRQRVHQRTQVCPARPHTPTLVVMAPGPRDGGAEAAARYRQYEYKAVRDDDDARATTDRRDARDDRPTTEGAAIEDGGGGRTNARRNRRRRARTRR